MTKLNNLLISCLGLVLCLCGCTEFDYKSTMASRTRNRTYIAEKVLDVKQNTSEQIPGDITQLLVFTGDTLKIVRNDSVVIRLVSYNSEGWIGDKADGKVLFEGLSENGRQSVLIELINPKEAIDGELILSPFMKGDYQQQLDTIRTYYKPYQ